MTTEHEAIRRRRLKELPLVVLFVVVIGGGWGIWRQVQNEETPAEPGARARAAGQLFESGDRDGALAMLEAILADDPDDARAHLELARIARLDGETERAEELLGRATELDPENAETWTSLGIFLLSLGRTGEAVPAFERAIEVDETSPTAHRFYGQILEAANRHSDARKHYESARRLEPEVPLHWLLEARILWKLYQPDLARTALAAARSSAKRDLTPEEEKLEWEVKDDLEVWPEGPPHNSGPSGGTPATPHGEGF